MVAGQQPVRISSGPAVPILRIRCSVSPRGPKQKTFLILSRRECPVCVPDSRVKISISDVLMRIRTIGMVNSSVGRAPRYCSAEIECDNRGLS